ncbi:MAG: energy-coupling factor transporter transmembrane component T [Candidatus Contubernalis sp.]|nr:energy-coupling factor transporter transmembrane component T [Candidatus Contubernalis sp.]
MIKDITMGQYYPAKSLLHDLDPRMKIVLLFFYMVLIFFVKTFYGFLFISLITFGMIKGSQLPVRLFLKGLRPILIIISFTLFLHAFFTKGGEVLLTVGPLTVETGGIVTGLFMTLRLMILVITTSLLTLTTSPIALTDGIEYLLSPLKKIGVPAHEMAMMMTISLRFIPILILESDKIMKAQLARGADFNRGGLVERAKNMVPLIVPLFVSAFRRADELASAMEARCYRGGKGRTRLNVLRLFPRDYYALSFLALVFVLVLATGL